MNVRTAGLTVAGTGVFTVLLLLLNADGIASVFSLAQLGALVGMPLAIVLHDELKSWPVVGVVAIALSISLSALAVQSLIWFGVASSEATVATATAYGVVLSWLLDSADFARGEAIGE